MRFEIRAGGLILIFLCLGGLSAAVFVFGLIAGHEMAHQEQAAQDVAAIYPLPSPPPAVATPAPAIGGAAAIPAEEVTPVPSAASALSSASSSASSGKSSSLGSAPKHGAVATSKLPGSGVASGTPATADENSTDENPDIAAAPTATPAAKHKNYSVQIEAVMDQQGADAMVVKLKGLGYLPYTVQTTIGGQTWYRVRVGPYPTPEEAKAAETKIHQEYGGSSPTP